MNPLHAYRDVGFEIKEPRVLSLIVLYFVYRIVIRKRFRSSRMASLLTNELKKFEGQPWTAWTDYLGCIVPPELYEENSGKNRVPCSKDHAGTMRLNKSDMAIYGQYPGLETFELAVCEYCGDKFKLAALTDHIELRHQDGKKVRASDLSNAPLSSKAKLLQLHLQKKGKSRCNTNRYSKERNDKPLPVSGSKVRSKTSDMERTYNKNENDNYLNPSNKHEKKTDKNEQQRTLSTLMKPEGGSKLKNIKLKLRKAKETNGVSCTKVLNNKLGKNNSIMNSNSAIIKSKEKQKLEHIIKKQVKSEPVHFQTTFKTTDKACVEIARMQPVVQLSPLKFIPTDGGCVKLPIMLQDPKRRIKDGKKILAMKDRTYNPDRHCGVIGKENTKPCTRSLTCKSHSMSLRRAVRGRSKAFDTLLADHRAEKEMFKQKLVNSNTPTAIEPSEVIVSSSSPPPVVLDTNRGETDVPKLRTKAAGQSVNENTRLSLPVSIKNPNVFTSLQNHDDKGKRAANSSVASNHSAANSARVLEASMLKQQFVNPLLSKYDCIIGARNTLYPVSFHSRHPVTYVRKKPLVKPWVMGYRRVGGLLYSNINLPKINGVSSKMDGNIIIDSVPVQNNSSSSTITVVKTPNSIQPISYQAPESPQSDNLKRVPLSLGPGKKKTVATLIPKQATSLLMPSMTLPGQSLLSGQLPKKTPTILQVANPQVQNGIVYCQNQVGMKRLVTDDAANVSPKKIKKDNKMNIVGHTASKNKTGNTVMRVSISNGVIEKEIVPKSSSVSNSLQPGVSLLQNNGVRLPSPRVHYVTSSGPLPVTLQQLPVVPQVQLKQVDVKSRIPPKFKLIAPNVTVTSGGMVFIHKDQRN